MTSHVREHLVPEPIEAIAAFGGVTTEHPIGHDEVVEAGLGVGPECVDEVLR